MLMQDVNILLESRFSSMNCQMFSTGLSSGDFDGKGIMVMLSGVFSSLAGCQPGLIDHEEGMSARGDGNGYFLQMKVQCVGVATGQDETRAYASGGTRWPRRYRPGRSADPWALRDVFPVSPSAG